MLIAVEGCAHGELETIYSTIQELENRDNVKVDLLLCCGDFQASRNLDDLECMAVPDKYKQICSFYKYYSGEKEAPYLTVLIGGNHEASNYFQELPYGGWVAPKIYYLGYAGVINVAGIRIAGLSGIYKGVDYMKGHYERPPYDTSTIRSVYHIRNVEVFRLKQLSKPIDIFLSHDWPSKIYDHGNKNQLIRFKPHFESDIKSGKLGSEPCGELLNILKPDYWFSAHLHCKFAALVPHEDKTTKFLALDKCLPKRRFLQIIDVPHRGSDIKLEYDLEWLAILTLTNHLSSFKRGLNYLPGPNSTERYDFTPTESEKAFVSDAFKDDLTIPDNFTRTAVPYDPTSPRKRTPPEPVRNEQTQTLCERLNIDDPMSLLLESTGNSFNLSLDDSLGETTFLNDTTLEDLAPTRKSLNLPEPVNEIKEIERPSVETVVCAERNDSFESAGGSPTVRTFKRRNIDIYRSDDS